MSSSPEMPTAPDMNILQIRAASRETLAMQVALLQQERGARHTERDLPTAAPNRRMGFVNSIEYYVDNDALLTELLDEMIGKLQPEPGEIPSFTFATLVTTFERDPVKAATIAALAVMRLAEIKRAAKAES